MSHEQQVGSLERVRLFIFQDEGKGDEMSIRIPELIDPAYGMYVWPCAPVLAKYVWMRRKWICGKRVLELGAGTSLPGIVAASCGAMVTLTDHSGLPRCLDNCLKSCRANGLEGKVDLLGLTWGEFSPTIFQLPQFDVILASDCFYDSRDFENIMATLHFFLDRNSDAKCWTTYQERSILSSGRNSSWAKCGRVVDLESAGSLASGCCFERLRLRADL
ncbi:methyltransferase-like protein 23 isoform X2 [Acanthaster planci]|uniref:Methyltransferase-like protein 23 isoform X2 n=1 Tax=Acanthaster planci TaxID=133434 RepID=A0A8B7YQ06_ACAPL|nr:methyltransferase-like protein 23 isoform X2 [Acanthaster planci]